MNSISIPSLMHKVRRPAGPGPHPTLIALHGRGSHEDDLLELADYLDPRLLWISPRAPLPQSGGFEWYRLHDIGVPDEASFTQGLRALDRFVSEAVAAYPVDPQQLYLFGFSQGGMMGYTLTLVQPARIRGLIAHSSYIPKLVLEQTAFDRAALAGKPILALHGTHDPLIPLAWAQAARDTLTELGVELSYQEFPMAHQVNQDSLAAMQTWLTQQLDRKANPQ
jgi:phospholipase/carboxylesterase